MDLRSTLLAEVCDAQSSNSALAGEALRSAGREIAALAIGRNLGVLAVDRSGERLVGAALLADERVRPVDTSRRCDGQSVLLVAGHIAGPTGLRRMASLARALGAVHVEGAVLGTRSDGIHGCEDLTSIAQAKLRLVAQ